MVVLKGRDPVPSSGSSSFRPGMVLILGAGWLIGSLSACTAPATIDERGRTVEHHFGYVRVIKPPRQAEIPDFQALGLRTYGIRIENGIGIGYLETERIVVPLDCRLVAIVRTQAQMDHLVAILSETDLEDLCVTVSPE